MSGTLKIGSKTIATHDTDTNVAKIQLGSTSDVVLTDSAGNNVLSESGGVVTLTADETNVGSNALVVDSSGNVGIGTSSPSEELEIRKDNATIYISGGASAYELTSTLKFTRAKIETAIQSGTANGDTRMEFHTRAYGIEAERMRIDSSGNVKINNLGTGTVYSNSGVLTNTNPSDLNLKENVVEVSYGLSELKQLRPVEFDWIVDEADRHELGFIAQEVQLIIPDLVNTYERIINEETGETEIGYGLESTQFIPVLVKAIQEQQTLIESQQSQIDALTARIEALETPAE